MDAGISKIRLNQNYFENSPEEIELENVTLIVGPNNSGKSYLLREIDSWLVSDRFRMKLLESIDLVFPKDKTEIEMLLRPFEIERKIERDGDTIISVSSPDLRQNGTPYNERINLRQFEEQAKLRYSIKFFYNAFSNQ